MQYFIVIPFGEKMKLFEMPDFVYELITFPVRDVSYKWFWTFV